MIRIPDLGDDFHEMWEELIYLAQAPKVPWTLVGAHMVALHGWEQGRAQVRPSKDADVLVDVRAVVDGTERFSAVLKEREFEFEAPSPEGIGHRFRKRGVTVDVLGPDGVGERANLRTLGGAHTVQVPGGTQALRRTVPTGILTRGTEGEIPLPNLLGALLVKTRAIAVDDEPDAQRGDCAFLLSLVLDPDPLGSDLQPTERSWLRKCPELGDPDAACYHGIDNAEDAAIVYHRLTT